MEQNESAQAPASGSGNSGQATKRWVRLIPWLLIGSLIIFHAANNWRWLAENVTLTGWDRPRHLAHSLTYARMLLGIAEQGSGLAPLAPIQSLFDVMVSDAVRPPLAPASATIMYWLFGWSSDVATMVNVIYMAIMLAATYGLGSRWGGHTGKSGRWQGLVSVALLAFFPMFYAMSRTFYLEFALTAMVALAAYLLVATDGFRKRGLSLLFGLSLGLGLLTKRTFAVFLAGPVLVVLLASGLLPMAWQRLKQRPRLHWKQALLAVVGGLALAALWYFPNQDKVRTLILGDGLFLIWWALAALAIYFIALPSAPLSNGLSAFFLAAALASTWYLARVEFVQRMVLYGYGVNDPRGRSLRLDSATTYLYYVRKLGNEHLSLVLFGLWVAVLIAAMVIYVRRQGSVAKALRQVQTEGWVVLSWIGGAYLLLTFSIYQETRAFLPVLPAVALLFGAALQKLPWRRVRLGLLALVLAFGILQFFLLSYEAANRLWAPRNFELPIWGQTSLLARGAYIELPDEGPTDRGYWIQPDILRRMEQNRQERGAESLSLGLLARTRQLNAGVFIYLILADYPHLRVESLTEYFDEAVPYQPIFAHEYVAVKGLNVGLAPAQEQIIKAIVNGTWPLFAQTFVLETTYLQPDGDTVYLYRQRYDLPADYPVEYVTRLAADLSGRTRSGDAILLGQPALASPLVSHYTGQADIYLVPASEDELAEIAARHRRLFLVLGDAPASAAASTGAEGGAIDLQAAARDWLNQHAFLASHEWADSLQLLTYGTMAVSPATAPAIGVQATLGDQIELVGYDLPETTWQAGDIVPLTLFWQRQPPTAQDYNVFIHLLDSGGQLVVQTDSAPVAGSRPTSTWQEGEMIIDRHGLLLPDTLPPGEHELRAGMYLPESGERLQIEGPDGQPAGDSIMLGHIQLVTP